MSGQDIAPPELAPPDRSGLTPEQGVALWMDVMDACDQFLLAGLRREIGPDGDLQEAHRRWYAEHMKDHDRAIFRMLEELSRRETSRGA